MRHEILFFPQEVCIIPSAVVSASHACEAPGAAHPLSGWGEGRDRRQGRILKRRIVNVKSEASYDCGVG